MADPQSLPVCIFCGRHVGPDDYPCDEAFDHMLSYVLESELGEEHRTY